MNKRIKKKKGIIETKMKYCRGFSQFGSPCWGYTKHKKLQNGEYECMGCGNRFRPSWYECPECGRVSDEESYIREENEHSLRHSDYWGHTEWDEVHKCPDCGTEYSFTNSNM